MPTSHKPRVARFQLSLRTAYLCLTCLCIVLGFTVTATVAIRGYLRYLDSALSLRLQESSRISQRSVCRRLVEEAVADGKEADVAAHAVSLLNSSSPDNRVFAAVLLGEVASVDELVRDGLHRALSDSNAEVRGAAEESCLLQLRRGRVTRDWISSIASDRSEEVRRIAERQ